MMPKLICLLAAALTLVTGAASAHSWYPQECCHDKDCHPVPCVEIEKISDGWQWGDQTTKKRHWFPHDRLHASHNDTCHVCVSGREWVATARASKSLKKHGGRLFFFSSKAVFALPVR
jgi:hypothetical protein